MNVQRLLKVCEEIEQTISQIYRHWQQVFTDDAALWKKMADDELDHARQIQLAKRVASENVFVSVNFSLASLEKALDKARKLLREVKEKNVSREQALRAAIRIEDEFSKAHLLNAANIMDKSMIMLFKSLSRSDEEHVKTLKDYHDSIQDKP